MLLKITGYENLEKIKSKLEDLVKSEGLKVDFNPNLEVETPLGVLTAEPHHDSHYPGVHLSFKKGEMLEYVTSVEVISEENKARALIYDDGVEEPSEIIELKVSN